MTKFIHKLVKDYYVKGRDEWGPNNPINPRSLHLVKGGYIKSTEGEVSVITMVK